MRGRLLRAVLQLRQGGDRMKKIDIDPGDTFDGLQSACCGADVKTGPGFSTYYSNCAQCGQLLASGPDTGEVLRADYDHPIGPRDGT